MSKSSKFEKILFSLLLVCVFCFGFSLSVLCDISSLDTAFAEVISLETGVEYIVSFDNIKNQTYSPPSSNIQNYANNLTAVISFNNLSFTIHSIQYSLTTYGFFTLSFWQETAPTTGYSTVNIFLQAFGGTSTSPNGTMRLNYYDGTYHTGVELTSDVILTFSSLPSMNRGVNDNAFVFDYLMDILDSPIIDYSPDLSAVLTEVTTVNPTGSFFDYYTLYSLVLNNPELYTVDSSTSAIIFNLEFLFYTENNPIWVVYDSGQLAFFEEPSGNYTAILMIDPYILENTNGTFKVLIYYDTYTTDYFEISDLSSGDVGFSPFTYNYGISSVFTGRVYSQGYFDGYQAGIDADKTLLSVMWQTFNLPFRLMFGDYDDNPSSPTYHQYVGGLFNFTLLGVDMRGFCIGLISFALVLAIIRMIIGFRS